MITDAEEVETPREIKSVAENLTDHVSDYVETYINLTGIKATQKVTEVATISFTAVMVSFFGLIILIFLGLGLAAMFSETMSPKEGFFIVTLIYTAVALIIFLLRKKLIFPFLRNQIVSKIYENGN
jgi:Putative Actinobacterial Holin-X, holin superfamily III